MLDAHIAGGLGCTVAGIRVPRTQASRVRGDRRRRRQQDRRVPGEAGRPARAARRPGVVVRLDGQLHLHHRRADRRPRTPTRRSRTPGTTWAATSSRASWTGARPRSTTSPPTPCRAPPTGTRRTGGTWGRSTPTTRRTWIWCRSTRSSTSTTRTGRSGPTRSRCPARSSPWAGSATDSIVSPGCIVSGGVIDDSVLSPNVRVMENAHVDQSVLLSNAWVGRERDRPPGDPGQERGRRGRGGGRGGPRGRPGPRLHRLRRRDHRGRQGRHRREGS